MFNPAIAKDIVKHALREIDFHPDHASWLTTSRTSTTDQNIAANQRLREQGRLRAEQIEKVEALEDGRFSVKIASGKTETYDYIVNCAGRSPAPGSPEVLPDIPVMKSVLDGGVARRDSLGPGLAMSRDGRALPAPGQLEGGRPANLFPIGPAVSKAELLHPQERTRGALNNTVAEAVPGLRPLAQRAADEIILNIYGRDVELPFRDHELDYVYNEDGVDEEPA